MFEDTDDMYPWIGRGFDMTLVEERCSSYLFPIGDGYGTDRFFGQLMIGDGYGFGYNYNVLFFKMGNGTGIPRV